MKKVYILLGLIIALLLPAISDAACDQDFYKTLRLGYQYKFGDNFSANGADRWIRTKKIDYSEQYDYNDSSTFPSFSWTSSIKNANWKVAKNTSMEIVTADDRYQVKKRPVSRSYDNLLVKYTIKYSNDAAGSTKYEHTECAHYEISWCGDGKVDSSYGEQCDPADTSHAGWGDMGCSNECKPISIPSGCDETFYKKLRYGHQYTFYDDFHANAGDKWLWTFNVYHNEKYDYNLSPSFPSFGWTSDIKNSSYKVSSNTTKRVLEATSQYSILAVPPKRAYDNLFIKYTLGYSTDAAGLNRYAHSECAYYEITRCGDGILDSDYETCDPADPNHAGWGNGGCNSSCQPVNVSAPVCSSTYNGQRVSDLSAGNHLCTEGSYSDFSYSETNHKWTWKCKNTAGTSVDCSAIKPYCGDGIKDSGEQCDPADTSHAGWGNGGCSASCQPVNISAPVCSSTYNGQRVSDLSAGNHLCSEGTYSDFSYDSNKHKWTWKCKNTAGNAVDCSAIKPYCGDGIKDSGEQCDPADANHAGWGNGGCNASCQPVNVPGPACSSTYNGQRVSDLSAGNHLCTEGTYSDFSYDSSKHKWTWKCKNTAGTSVDCLAIKPYCGDGVKDSGEQCDPADTSHTGWGDGGCSASCQPIGAGGKLTISKTLIGTKEIKKVGDNVVWNIKVTAEGGDVTNFRVKDKMPEVLGYSSYIVTHNPGLTVGTPTVDGDTITWKVTGTISKGEYLEIQLTTYAKVMPDKDYKNVACVRPEDKPDEEKCDDEPIPSPNLRLKKSFTDGTKTKTVNIGDEIGYKITFGNKGTASATITSIKDFLPKNVQYVSSTIYVNGQSTHSNNPSGSEVINSSKKVDGVYIDIYGGITLEPKAEGYIILTGKILKDNQDNRTNFACIYLNDKKIECDDAIHNISGKLMCTKPEIKTTSFTNAGGSTDVTCKTSPSGEKAKITLDCGNGTTYSESNVSSLTKTCQYGANSSTSTKTYTVVCKVNDETTDECKGTVSVSGKDNPPSTCFIAGTKVTMADGTEKNIEEVKIGEKVLGTDGTVNTVLGYDRPRLGNRHLWSINGSEYFVSDEHPFKTTEGWKSFNPEMTKKEVDLDTTELKVGDILITSNGLEEIKSADYISNNPDTQLYNFILDGDNTYYANSYLVHNKGGGEDPHCKAPEITNDGDYKRKVTCKTDNGEDYLIGIKCSKNDTIHVSKEKTSSFTYTCSYSSNGNYDIQCYVPKYKSATTVTEEDTKPSSCGKQDCIGSNCGTSSCFVAGTKVTMADGSKKNIEDVKIGEKLLGEDGEINTVLGYDRPVLGNRHLWSINGGEYFVSDEHPFKTTQGWKSFNPEMTKLEIDLNTTELKVGDKMITEKGIEEVKTASYIEENYNTQLYNFVLNGNHTYYANSYLVHNKGGGGGSCFIAGTKVTMADGTEKNIEEVKIGEKLLGEKGENTVLGYDRPQLGSRHLWSINGGEYFVSDEHPFKTTKGWKSFNPEMTKLEIDLNTTELKVGDILITNKGLEMVKTINSIDADYNTQLYNFVLDGDHTYYADNYLVHNKGGGGGGGSDPIYDSANCFDVNTNNVSIQQGEILPFYWNIKNMKNIKDWAMDLTGGFKSTASDIESSIINKYNGKSCSEDDDGFIGLNSMICHFKITNGNSASNAVYEGDFPCLRDTGGRGESYVSNYGLLNAWMTYGRNKYRGNGNYQFFWTFSNRDRNYALRSNINYIENFGERDRNGRTIDTFGEYKLSLTSIKYLQCRDEKWNLVSPEITVCENNFTLTNPYTVQKTPSGNLKASTTTLDKYLYKNGNSIVKASKLLNAISATEYEPNNTVDTAMTDFTKKYQKLAVTVKNENGKVIKKVPGKNIYFVEGDITLGGNKSSIKVDNPVTIVQTRGDTTIDGDLNYNMMLLTNGNIKFQDPSSCNHRQVVKGVFYAKGGISRTTVQRNNNLNNGQRCTEGGLTIKGVLIGRGLQGVMNESRSNLNGWFNSTDKKSIVMNGASVIIEYAPSVFTKATMPPGAEYFTTALSIYKN